MKLFLGKDVEYVAYLYLRSSAIYTAKTVVKEMSLSIKELIK